MHAARKDRTRVVRWPAREEIDARQTGWGLPAGKQLLHLADEEVAIGLDVARLARAG